MSEPKAPLRPLPIEAHPDEVEIHLYQAHQKIYPRAVEGLFAYWRWGLVIFTQVLFYGLPWLEWGTRQALLFDLDARRFYIFGLIFYPQDIIYLTGLLVISALSLFLFTAVAGRLWCGYACPQTVYSEIFMWIERKVEGDRSARMRLDESDFSAHKFSRKMIKHSIWIALALWTGLTFVGYFTPIRVLWSEVWQGGTTNWETFWILFYGFATYGNAGFMREQVCKYMCPYARFQSAMFDHDTLIVTYDSQRGEPRGARSRKADRAQHQLGECVDCTLCVQVCPTGIDIRKGLQYECIGCGACADVCDTVMDKMGYPRGLVRYTTQNALNYGWSRRQMWQRVLRPRVVIYGAILLALVMGLLVALSQRMPFKVDVVRDRATLARINESGQIENIYRLQIMNATEQDQRFTIAVKGLDGLALATDTEVSVDAVQSRWIVSRVTLPYDSARSGSHGIQFVIQNTHSHDPLIEKTVFLVPR